MAALISRHFGSIHDFGVDDFAFGLMLGDIVRNDLSLFDPYLPVNARLPGPIFHVVGNHDVDYDATNPVDAVATFNRHFGPADYALMEGEAVFIVLNNVYTPLPGRAPRTALQVPAGPLTSIR